MAMSDRGGGSRREWHGAEIAGIVLVAIGVVYLLGNLGIVRVAWSVIWPILIIAIGAILLYGAVRPSRRKASSAAVARDGAARLELDLGIGAGHFRIEGGASTGQLVEVSSTNEDIATRVEHVGDRAIVRLRQDFAWWPGAWRGGSEWTVRVAADVPTILTMNAGAGEFTVDLSAIAVVQARIQIGAAQARIVLPRPRGTVEIRVSGGATELTFVPPPGVEYRLETSGGLTSVDGRTESLGFATASDRVLIRFSGGASSVRIG
jgi:cell wall-active antibiotic response 4TMS protein YvqF